MGLFYHAQSVVLNCGSNINQSQQNMAVIACLNGKKTVIRLRFSMQLRKFDNARIDCMEVSMGMLVRRKKGENYEWVIEI